MTSDWRVRALGELLEVKHGYAFKGALFSTGGSQRLVTPGNFYERGGFRDRGVSQKSFEGDPPAEYVLAPGSLVLAMTEQASGLLGSAGLIPEDRQTWLHNQRIGLVRPTNGQADTRFLYYLFNAPSVRAQINATATGTKVRHTAPDRIEGVRTAVPSESTQRSIAAILFGFDQFIEINERRIELLEDLARSLYREWFVRFRFPSHESVPLVKSDLGPIPRGWDVRPLGEIMTLAYGKALPRKHRRSGSVSVVSSAGVVDQHDESLVSGPGVVVGRKGNVGSVWWVDRDFFPIDTAYYVETDAPLGLVYRQLLDMTFIDSHAAVPGLSREQAYALPLLRPPRDVAEHFGVRHDSLFNEISMRRDHNRALAATRDLLLPRLVTGKLDISEIDLGELLPAEAA